MTRRSRLSYPGGFVPAVSVLAGFELDFHRCALCSHSIDAKRLAALCELALRLPHVSR
jgi:hypothetical protein